MKRRLFVGIVGFLAIANISALGTFIYYKTTLAGEVSSATTPTGGSSSSSNCSESECPMATELSLTEKQMGEMRSQQTRINRSILGLSHQIAQIRADLIEELMRPEPDVNRMNQKLRVVDSLQSAIQHITIENLVEVKKALNDEQQKILFHRILRECKKGSNQVSQSHDPSATHHERN